jgi:hypothetical protein
MHGPLIAKQIFISRAGAEAALAVTIADILRAAGYDVILEDRDFANMGVVNTIMKGCKPPSASLRFCRLIISEATIAVLNGRASSPAIR